jgi:RNA polymerase sigma factor (sigma-70 family)
MATISLVRHLGSLFEDGSAAGFSDRQLLERFTARGEPADEAAFAAIVSRHGPMVMGVCRQLLGDHHDAEDAFQAVFFVLARQARSIRDPDRLGFWLYGVALRTAQATRRRLGRHRRIEEQGAAGRPEARPAMQAECAIDREHAEALHREIQRLPEPFRLAVVSCYLQGLSPDEAAERLRWSGGTLRSRLVRAREKLRAGLARRGIALSATALTALLEPRAARASVPPLLCDSTARAAIAFAAHTAAAGGAVAPAATLAQEVLKTMLIHKLRLVATAVLALAAIATGAGYLARSMAMKEESVKDPKPTAAPVAERPRPRAKADPAPAARMTVAGRVVDPDGKPVKGALVDVVGASRTPWVGAREDSSSFQALGQAETDADGRFQLETTRTSSTRVSGLLAIAAAPGFGRGVGQLNPDAERPEVTIRLYPEEVRRVRLVELSGAPARGVTVYIKGFHKRDPADQMTEGIGAWLGEVTPPGLRAWPEPVKSDDQGRIVLTGFGRGFGLSCQVRDVPYARQDVMLEPAGPAGDGEKTVALQPARIIEGRVLAADTGQPIPHAIVSASAFIRNQYANGIFTHKFRADAQGRFVMNPIAGKIGYAKPDAEGFVVGAFPPDGEPYLIQQDEVPWTKGAVKATHDIRLTRGVLIRGKVTEQGTGRPLPASSIQFIPTRSDDRVLSGWQAIVASGDDGSFAIAVLPGKGHLLVYGPTADYILNEIGSNLLYGHGPGGMRYRAHAIIPYEVKAGDLPREVAAELRPGATIKGRVEGPDGQTITRATIITTLRAEAYNPHWRGDYQIPVADGRFELHGLDPKGTARVHILDADHEWGATVEASGQKADEELVVRLQPCGKATARFVGPDGKPIAGHQPTFDFVATPGPGRFSRAPKDRAELSADEDFVANVDRKHYWHLPRTGADGRFAMASLIPGALYRLSDFSTANDEKKGMQVRREFTVKPGETLDLGDILIEKPQER